MDYNTFRELADSWGLLYLFALFVGIAFFTFRPGSGKVAQRVAQIPLTEDDQDV